MFFRSLPETLRAFRLNAKVAELTLLNSALLGIAIIIKVRIGPR